MTAIPPAEVTQADLEEWFRLKELLNKVKTSEMLLRMKIFNGKFIDPAEGTNSVDLADGYVLKGTRKIDRKVDIGSLAAIRAKFEEMQIQEGLLFKYTPELVIKPYRALSDEQRHLVDQALIIKDGAPSLEIMMPAKNRPAG